MNDHPVHPEGHQTYLVTQDVAQKVATFGTIGIKAPDPDDKFYDRLNQDLLDAVQSALQPSVNVRSIRMSDLASNVLAHAYSTRKSQGSLIVSTCREFAEPMKGVTLDINRLVDRGGNSLGIGSRPGTPPLSEQLRVIKSHAGDRPVVIIEDGIFSGGTVQYVVDQCRSSGIEVNQVIVGFRFASSQEKIDHLAEQGVEVAWLEEFGDLIDWVPDHDFLPMIPNCGRILGVSPFDQPTPYYSEEGAAYSMPYVFPFSPVEQWASIPEGAKRDLAKVCLSLSQQVYTKLNILNDREIRVEEVLSAPQPVTLPFKLGSRKSPAAGKQSVSSFLNELSHTVASDLYQA